MKRLIKLILIILCLALIKSESNDLNSNDRVFLESDETIKNRRNLWDFHSLFKEDTSMNDTIQKFVEIDKMNLAMLKSLGDKISTLEKKTEVLEEKSTMEPTTKCKCEEIYSQLEKHESILFEVESLKKSNKKLLEKDEENSALINGLLKKPVSIPSEVESRIKSNEEILKKVE